MKSIILSIGLLMSGHAFAQSTFYYGANGAPAGRSFTQNGTTFYYGSNGAPAGRAVESGSATHYYGSDNTYYGHTNNYGY